MDLNWPRDIFILAACSQHSQSYGLQLPKKFVHDSNGRLISINPKKNRADVSLAYRCTNMYVHPHVDYDGLSYYEIKSSLAGPSGIHNIDHIRDFQKELDFFILFLIDDYDNYRERCYVLPKKFITENSEFTLKNMTGTKEVNKFNKYTEKSFALRKEIAYSIFDKGNILPSTEYSDLINYIEYMSDTVHILTNNMTISHKIGHSPFKRSNVNPIVNANVSYLSDTYTLSSKFQKKGKKLKGRRSKVN
jgi:hypothetical protein